MNIAVYQEIKLLEKLSPEMGGVFSIKDLEVLFKSNSRAGFFNKIKSLQKIGILTGFKKSFYTVNNFSPEILSARIDPDAYISMGTVLSRNGLIGTIPQRILTAVHVGRNRSYVGTGLEIKHYGISEHLYFGFDVVNGVKVANSEKAYLDVLYYRMKGHKYVFDEISDVDISRLDQKLCSRYLSKYRNKRFVQFCKEVLNGQ